MELVPLKEIQEILHPFHYVKFSKKWLPSMNQEVGPHQTVNLLAP